MFANIVRTFTRARAEFEEYYQSAIEQCSHNLSDDRMNEFFIEGSVSAYSDNPHLAPWYRGPLVYLTHMDLLTDLFGGSKEAIKAAAIELSQRLHPANITLTELEAFRDKLIVFWETYYQPTTGTAAQVAHYQWFVRKIIFGGNDSDDGSVAIIKDLPTPVNLDYLGFSYMTGETVSVDVDDLP